MAAQAKVSAPEQGGWNRRLAILLAMAMFVLVVDTSLMNVSISAVVRGPGHHRQRRPVGDRARGARLGRVHPDRQQGRRPDRPQAGLRHRPARLRRRRAGDDARPEPGRRSSSSGRSSAGSAPRCCCRRCSRSSTATSRARPRSGCTRWSAPSAAIAAAVGPLLGGFITTFLSWRVGFLLELVVIAVVLSGIRLVRDVPYTGTARDRSRSARVLSVLGMGGIVLGILVWQEGGEAVGVLLAVGVVALGPLGWWLVRRKRQGKVTLIDPDLFRSTIFRLGITGQMLQQIALGRRDDRAADLPADGARVQRDAGRACRIAPAVADDVRGRDAGREAGRATGARPASSGAGFVLLTVGVLVLIPVVPRGGLRAGAWLIPLVVAGPGSGCWCRSSTTTRWRRSPRSGSARPPA